MKIPGRRSTNPEIHDIVDALDRLTQAVYAHAEHTAPTDYQRENAGARYDSIYPREGQE